MPSNDKEWDDLEAKLRALRSDYREANPLVVLPVSVELARKLLMATGAPRDYTFEQLVEVACEQLHESTGIRMALDALVLQIPRLEKELHAAIAERDSLARQLKTLIESMPGDGT